MMFYVIRYDNRRDYLNMLFLKQKIESLRKFMSGIVLSKFNENWNAIFGLSEFKQKCVDFLSGYDYL